MEFLSWEFQNFENDLNIFVQSQQKNFSDIPKIYLPNFHKTNVTVVIFTSTLPKFPKKYDDFWTLMMTLRCILNIAEISQTFQ